jgi:hypothetical protein
VVVANPPAPVAYPRAVDARLAVSAGALATIDARDIIKVAFDKAMRTPATGRLLLSDVDGTVAELRCGTDAVSCALNTGAETIGGATYDVGFVVTLEVRMAPRVVVEGSIAGLQSHATIIVGELADAGGNAWDLARSDDVVIGAPD